MKNSIDRELGKVSISMNSQGQMENFSDASISEIIRTFFCFWSMLKSSSTFIKLQFINFIFNVTSRGKKYVRIFYDIFFMILLFFGLKNVFHYNYNFCLFLIKTHCFFISVSFYFNQLDVLFKFRNPFSSFLKNTLTFKYLKLFTS